MRTSKKLESVIIPGLVFVALVGFWLVPFQSLAGDIEPIGTGIDGDPDDALDFYVSGGDPGDGIGPHSNMYFGDPWEGFVKPVTGLFGDAGDGMDFSTGDPTDALDNTDVLIFGWISFCGWQLQ